MLLYNLWLRGMWSDDIFSMTYLPVKTSCLLQVDSTSKRDDLMNKTKACFVTTVAYLLPNVVLVQLSTPLLARDVLPMCVCLYVCMVHSCLVQQLEVRLALTLCR